MLLRYLIDQQLAGKADRLKGFSIAVDVFGKDADYDSSTDATVRVQAGRLRELLEQYFAGEGAGEPVRITIRRGSYIPAYSLAAAQVPAAIELLTPGQATPAMPRRRASRPVGAGNGRNSLAHQVTRQLRLFWAAFAMVFVLLGFVAWNSWRDANFEMSMSANAAPATRIADSTVSLPHVFMHIGDDETARRTGNVMRTALAGLDTVVYVARPAPSAGNAAALDFEFDLERGPTEGSVNVSLQNIRSGEVINSRLLSDSEMRPERINDTIADVITATLPVSGALYAYLEANGLQRGLTRCLLMNDNYYLEQSEEKHRTAYDCFDTMLKAGAHSPLIISELASLHLEAVTDKYLHPPGASMESGLQLARRAVQMAPTSPYAHRAYGFLYTRMGITGEALKWMKKAYELGRYDLNMAAAYGYALIMAGNYDEGTPVIFSAVTKSSARPSWWDYTLFLGAFMTGQLGLAADAADSLTATRRPLYLAARLLAAHHRGDAEAVDGLRAELDEKHKTFVANPRSFYERADYPPDMVEKLVDALRAAGLAAES